MDILKAAMQSFDRTFRLRMVTGGLAFKHITGSDHIGHPKAGDPIKN
jgi:hypothetical protein